MSSSEAGPNSFNRVGAKRRRSVISCLECHRRKQKCDRLQPCSNCINRGKQSICRYENVTTSESRPERTSVTGTPQTISDLSTGPEVASILEPQVPLDHGQVTKDLGYSSHYSSNTLSILRKLGTLETGQSTAQALPQRSNKFHDKLSQEYWELIRRLPSKKIIDTLVTVYFTAVGWQYDVIDEITFRNCLTAWRSVDYFLLQQGPRALSIDMRFFPALLFQILAQSLLNEPPVGDDDLENLKGAPGMTFHDLAEEFSEAGSSLVTLLGQSETTMGLIQAHFMRVWFLKSIGRVVDAWHWLGLTIRDAQEFGLHVEPGWGESFPFVAGPLEEKQWADEMHRRMWLVLRLWDVHMAVVLGRPLLISSYTPGPQLPRDIQVRRTNTGPIGRTAMDPPTPFTILLVGYHAAFKYLWTIHGLVTKSEESDEHEGVEEVDYAILNNIQSLPAWSRLEDPDSAFDELPGCQWLPLAREFLWSEIYLCRLALHKSYIFSAPKSRSAALAAALKILRSQSHLFHSISSNQYRLFTSVFNSFDAIVIACSIHLLYPTENHELLDTSLQCISWGLDRLNTVGHHNSMAKKAHGVVLNLYDRLMHLLTSLGVLGRVMPIRPGSGLARREEFSVGENESSARTDLSRPPGVGQARQGFGGMSSSAPGIDGFAPLQPMHDLFFQNLSSNYLPASDRLSSTQHSDFAYDERLFEGLLPDDSFWVFMNNNT